MVTVSPQATDTLPHQASYGSCWQSESRKAWATNARARAVTVVRRHRRCTSTRGSGASSRALPETAPSDLSGQQRGWRPARRSDGGYGASAERGRERRHCSSANVKRGCQWGHMADRPIGQTPIGRRLACSPGRALLTEYLGACGAAPPNLSKCFFSAVYNDATMQRAVNNA